MSNHSFTGKGKFYVLYRIEKNFREKERSGSWWALWMVMNEAGLHLLRIWDDESLIFVNTQQPSWSRTDSHMYQWNQDVTPIDSIFTTCHAHWSLFNQGPNGNSDTHTAPTVCCTKTSGLCWVSVALCKSRQMCCWGGVELPLLWPWTQPSGVLLCNQGPQYN